MKPADQRAFARDFGALDRIFEFTSAFFARHRIDPRLQHGVDFSLEELFTNMVKYAAADVPGSEIRIELAVVPGGVEVALVDAGVDAFDVTQAPDAEVDLPAEARRPGGLGLHLIRRLVDRWEYHYDPATRTARITFRKTTAGSPARAGSMTGEG